MEAPKGLRAILAFFAAITLLLTASSLAGPLLYESEWSGNTINTFTTSGVKANFASGLSNPSGLAFDNAGNLFCADEGSGNIYQFTPGGARSTFASGVGQPVGLAFDSAGNLYCSDVSASNTKIYKFTPSATRTVFATGFLFPLGIVFDPLDNLYVADFNKIDKITPAGVVTTFAGADTGAVGLARNTGGNLFLTDDQPDVWKYAVNGASRTLFGTVPNRAGAIAFDPTGILFVADRGATANTGAIYWFTPGGTRTLFATGLNNPENGIAFSGLFPEPDCAAAAVLILAANASLRGRRNPRRSHGHHPLEASVRG